MEEQGGVPVLGVIPYLYNLDIPEEDAVALDTPPEEEATRHMRTALGPPGGSIHIAVIRLPHIANFDDFDPLAAEPGVRVRYVSSRQALGRPQAVILPGTKSTLADLAWLKGQGLAEAIQQLAQKGTAVVGICGGYQMLGQVIHDPGHVESSTGECSGLELLPAETAFEGKKATYQVEARVLGGPGWLKYLVGERLQGYEIHMGRTRGGQRWLEVTERNETAVNLSDGDVSSDGRIWGCYLHGLFENRALRHAWLSELGWRGSKEHTSPLPRHEAAFERLANAVEEALDMEALEVIASGG